MRVLRARWLFPVATPPIADGAVAVEAGRIIGVGARADVEAAWPDAAGWGPGDTALLPGLVNCHTHLDGRPPPAGGIAGIVGPWVVRLIEARRARRTRRRRGRRRQACRRCCDPARRRWAR